MGGIVPKTVGIRCALAALKLIFLGLSVPTVTQSYGRGKRLSVCSAKKSKNRGEPVRNVLCLYAMAAKKAT